MRRSLMRGGISLLVAISLAVPTTFVEAHPGRTDSSGCHTCRTNCPDWGLQYGEYHCHNGGGSGGGGSSSSDDDSNDNTGTIVTVTVVTVAVLVLLIWAIQKKQADQSFDYSSVTGLPEALCNEGNRSHNALDHLREHTVLTCDPEAGTATVALQFAF